MKKIRCGIVGVAGRGRIYVKPLTDVPEVEITAICDIDEEGLEKWANEIGNVKTFIDYKEMLDSGIVDAVVIATPVPLHVEQAVYALERNIHVLSEVPAGSTLEECKKLYITAKNSKAQYMLAENVNYYKSVIIIENIIKAGLIGDIHYGESQYLHYLEKMEEWRVATPNGCGYCTHNLGPILKWFKDDQIEKICCIGSGIHRIYDNKELAREMNKVMLCKTKSGKLCSVRLDFDTPTPYMLTFEVSGTKGKIMIRSTAPDKTYIHIKSDKYESEEWKSLEYYEKEFLPSAWTELGKKIENIGHQRGDYVLARDFIDALANNKKVPIDIDMAMNMTLPGILSVDSINHGGKWIDVPDLND